MARFTSWLRGDGGKRSGLRDAPRVRSRRTDGSLGPALGAVVALGTTIACSTPDGAPQNGPSDGSGSSGPIVGTGGAGQGSGTGGSAAGSSTNAGGSPTEPNEATTLLGARIRKLTNDEYDATVQALLGVDTKPSSAFNQDVRQSGYARNEAQVVDTILAGQYHEAAKALAEDAVTNHYAHVVPCETQDEDCAIEFVEAFGERAYRGAFDEARRDAITAVFQAGADEGTFEDGVELAITAVLQSPYFLYHLEIGNGPDAPDPVLLSQREIANSVSYLITGAPPDGELLAAAAASKLGVAEERVAQAKRLLSTAPAEAQIRRLVVEWLGLNGFTKKGKDAVVYPDFLEYRSSMIQETNKFIEEVVFRDDATLETLFSAKFSVLDEPMAEFYGVSGTGLTDLGSIERRGILNHASWLSATAHGDDSGPVVRGLKLLTKVLCANVPGHAQLGVAAPFPPNDGVTSARDRIEAHTQVSSCASCHDVIDRAGFLFENYDGMGRLRAEDNGVAVDTSGELSPNASQWGVEETSGTFANSQELIAVVAKSRDMRRCFTKNVTRFATATRIKDIEDDFLTTERAWVDDPSGDVKQLLLDHVRDPSFPFRSTLPPVATYIDEDFQ